jgi:hypothetical protein
MSSGITSSLGHHELMDTTDRLPSQILNSQSEPNRSGSSKRFIFFCSRSTTTVVWLQLIRRRLQALATVNWLRPTIVTQVCVDSSLLPTLMHGPENQAGQRRSTRSTRGQGGAIAQLERVVRDIQPSFEHAQKRKTTVDNMPEDLSDNDMAPPPSKKRLRHSQVSFYFFLTSLKLTLFIGGQGNGQRKSWPSIAR